MRPVYQAFMQSAALVALIACGARAETLFVGSQTGSAIYEYASDGTRSTFVSGTASSPLYPISLAFDPNGNLFESDYQLTFAPNGRIYEFSPDGAQSTFLSGQFALPGGLAFDAAGNLFQGDLNGNIYEYPAGGGARVNLNSLLMPTGLTFAPNGTLYIADAGNGTIHEFVSANHFPTFVSGLNSPYGLAFDKNSNLFEADAGSGKIYEFSPAGVRSTFATGLGEPFGLAFDSQGNLFASDYTAGAIYEFTPGGIRSTFATVATPTALVFLPEPSTLALAAFAFAGLAAWGWRRRMGSG
jgi:sugar lactone lactonase YvrE